MKEPLHVPGWPPALGRTYEDHVLGKLYADWTFERASDALRRYQGKDRARGLAYLVNQLYDSVNVQQALEQRLPGNMKGLAAPLSTALRLWFSHAHEIHRRRPACVTVPFGAAHALGPSPSLPVRPHARRREHGR